MSKADRERKANEERETQRLAAEAKLRQRAKEERERETHKRVLEHWDALTAEEITALDLRSVEWAVLSACDTGVGEVRTGEGVLGLRRSLLVAGTRTIIMSLWQVEDSIAREWMEHAYRARLSNGEPTAGAMRAAEIALLTARRRAGESTHPFYWAGFVAVGDWR